MNDEDVQDIEFTSREPGTLPWFQFWSNRWMGSATITKMSLAHQAIYLRLMCVLRTYGSLSRDPWVLSKLLGGVRFETLRHWMKENGAEGEVIHDEGCEFTGKQPLISSYTVTTKPEQKCSDGVAPVYSPCSARVAPVQCLCESWTLPKFLKLQTFTKKSSADLPQNPAGEERKGQERDISSIPTTSARKKKAPSTKPVPKHWPGDPDPNCNTCHGRGNWVETQDGKPITVSCRCTAE